MSSTTNNTSNRDETILNDLKKVFKNNLSSRDNSSRRDYKLTYKMRF